MSQHDMRRRLALAYHEAMAAAHGRGRPEIHAGRDVQMWMLDQCKQVANYSPPGTMTCWGVPVIEADGEFGPDHLSVHVVTVIV